MRSILKTKKINKYHQETHKIQQILLKNKKENSINNKVMKTKIMKKRAKCKQIFKMQIKM